MKKFDAILVGAGPSGIFCAYELINKNPKMNILLLEKGHEISKRICPKRKTGKCINCNPCNITCGFSGAGAFSDGKLTLAKQETGGNLSELIGPDKTGELIKKIDDVYLSFGADTKLHGVDNKEAIASIRKKAIQADLKLIESPIRHLGTEASYEIYGKLEKFLLKHGVTIMFDTMVNDIIEEDGVIKGVATKKDEFYSDVVVVGSGREGSAWFQEICKKHHIESVPGTVDIGVRVECRDEIMKELNDAMYESKLIYYTKTFSDKVRTFCQNPSGEVALENYTLANGKHLTTVNGHAYKGDSLKTENTNFALLVSKNFTEPFKEPLEYGVAIASLANMLAGGGVLVQSYGDFKKHRRSTPDRIRTGNVVPTLKDAIPGDLSAVIPYRIFEDIIEMLEAMDKIVPGIANNETLLYGVEVKFYSNKVIIGEDCQTSIKGLYSVGDSSSWTRGLSLASAMGLYVADNILNK